MEPVLNFIYLLEGAQREIASILHEEITSIPGVEPKIRYRIPFYYRKRWLCYLNPIKGDGIELAFTRANELSGVEGLVDFRGRKQVAGIQLYDSQKLPLLEIREVLHEAVLLDKAG